MFKYMAEMRILIGFCTVLWVIFDNAGVTDSSSNTLQSRIKLRRKCHFNGQKIKRNEVAAEFLDACAVLKCVYNKKKKVSKLEVIPIVGCSCSHAGRYNIGSVKNYQDNPWNDKVEKIPFIDKEKEENKIAGNRKDNRSKRKSERPRVNVRRQNSNINNVYQQIPKNNKNETPKEKSKNRQTIDNSSKVRKNSKATWNTQTEDIIANDEPNKTKKDKSKDKQLNKRTKSKKLKSRMKSKSKKTLQVGSEAARYSKDSLRLKQTQQKSGIKSKLKTKSQIKSNENENINKTQKSIQVEKRRLISTESKRKYKMKNKLKSLIKGTMKRNQNTSKSLRFQSNPARRQDQGSQKIKHVQQEYETKAEINQIPLLGKTGKNKDKTRKTRSNIRSRKSKKKCKFNEKKFKANKLVATFPDQCLELKCLKISKKISEIQAITIPGCICAGDEPGQDLTTCSCDEL